ncbi:hypothetical protein JCM10049v2_004464 [Rhodotorula toruloides]
MYARRSRSNRAARRRRRFPRSLSPSSSAEPTRSLATDQDTDRYVFEVLAPHLRTSLRASKKTLQWTDNCAEHLRKLHAEGFGKEDVLGALRQVPVHPAMRRAFVDLKASKDPQVTTFILSNANSVYIDTILKHYGVENAIDEVVTNPAQFREDGLLELRRRVDPNGPQHQCKVGCSPNMCKGEELEAFMARNGGWDSFDKVVYIGDGANDLCPILHLRSQDVALVRLYRELYRRLQDSTAAHTSDVKCKVVSWGGAWEVEKWLKEEL